MGLTSRAHERPRAAGPHRQPRKKDLKHLRRVSDAALARLDLPDGCGIATLMEHLSADRGRPIRLVPLSLGVKTPCGMWLATDTFDVIIVEAETSRLHQDHIIAHELAHMLCHHRDSAGFDTATMRELMPHLDPGRVREMMGRTSYSTTEEQEAEIVASLILERVTRPPVESVWRVPSADAETVARIENSLNPNAGPHAQ